jgi:hypothetical protein
MFGTFRKHQTWLWLVIIAVTCLSMVIYFQPGGKNGNQPTSSGNYGSIDNKKITEAEKQMATKEAALMYYLRTHEWPGNGASSKQFDWDRETYQRLFLIRRLEQYNIHADPDATAKLAGMILRQFGNGQQVPMEAFESQILKQENISAEDFQHFLEHDIAIQQLVSIVGASGKLVTPAEIQSLFVHENQELACDVVFFNASNYLAKIQDPQPEALAQFYTNQQANYREPDQMQVSYVYFNVTNFLPEAEQQLGTNLNRAAEEAMTRLGTNAFRLGKTVDEARAKVRELLIRDKASTNAYNKAVAIQNEVVSREPQRVENLETVAKEKGLEVKVTKPFEKEYGPSELDLRSNSGQDRYPVASLFNLTPADPFVDRPIPGEDGVYIVAFNKLIPSRVPPLDEIRSRVTADFKFVQAMRVAQMNGHVFAQTATNELAHGKTWEETCKTTGVTPEAVAPFSLSSQRIPEVENNADAGAFKEAAITTKVGSASAFTPTPNGGFVVHVKQQLPIDDAKMKTQLPEFSKMVRQRRESEAFEIWFNQEASRALRDIPAFQRPSTVQR